MRAPRRIALAASLLALPAAGATAQENDQCTPEDVRVTLGVRSDSYGRDEPVRFRLRARNTSNQTCEMQFPSGRGGTVRVFDGHDPIWEHGYCRVYTDHIELQQWEPGHHDSWRFRWRQKEYGRTGKRFDCDKPRALAEPGRYTAKGIFFGTDPDAKTTRIAFRLTG